MLLILPHTVSAAHNLRLLLQDLFLWICTSHPSAQGQPVSRLCALACMTRDRSSGPVRLDQPKCLLKKRSKAACPRNVPRSHHAAAILHELRVYWSLRDTLRACVHQPPHARFCCPVGAILLPFDCVLETVWQAGVSDTNVGTTSTLTDRIHISALFLRDFTTNGRKIGWK